MIKTVSHWLTVSIFSTKNASSNIWRQRSHSLSVLSHAVIHNAEKNSLQKTLKVYCQEKITIVSKIILFSRLSQSKGIFHGALLQTAIMLSFSIREEMARISSVSNAKRNIVSIANRMLTRNSLVKNLSETVILISLIELSNSLWKVQSTSSALSARCGSKRLRAAITWHADAAPNSAMYAVASIRGVLVSTAVKVAKAESTIVKIL